MTTDDSVTQVADDLRAAVAAYNAAVRRASALGLRVELETVRMQEIGIGEFPVLTVRVFEPR